jgi:hypothetical protein
MSVDFRRPLAVLALAASPLLAEAQRAPRPDYFVGLPQGRLTIRGGADAPMARSDFWDFTTDQLTLSRSGLGAPSVAAEFGALLGSHVEVTFGAGISDRSTGSTYRRLVDTQNAEIEQRTALQRIPVVVGMRVNLLAPVTRAGSIAVIPRRVVPYVAAGGGMMRWELRQSGDFVDFQDLGVFPASYRTSGWTPTGFAAAGADISVGTRTFLALDARYTFARGRLGAEAFQGFAPIDLSSVAVTAGLGWRF